MSEKKSICSVSDIDEGEVRGFTVDSIRIAVYHAPDGVFYATQDNCSHGQMSLSEGYLDGFEIECPLHQGTFDIRSGAPTSLPCITPIKTFALEVIDDQVYLAQ